MVIYCLLYRVRFSFGHTIFASPPPSEDSDGNMVEEVVVGPVPKPQVTLSKKDYGKVRSIPWHLLCYSFLWLEFFYH